MTPLQRLREAAEETGWSVDSALGWIAILNSEGGVVVGVRSHRGGRRVVSYDGFSIEAELMRLLLDAAQ